MVRLKLYFIPLFPNNSLFLQGEESPSVWRQAQQSPDLLGMVKDLHLLWDVTTGSLVWSKSALQVAGDFLLA